MKIQLIAVVIFLTAILPAVCAQNNPGLAVIRKHKTYKQLLGQDSSKRMVELRKIIPGIHYDLRYATTNNFMHQRLYKSGKFTYLRSTVASALAKVQQELDIKGLSLKIWDAYRPYSVTVKMWEPIKDERYVADPKKGSGHNRGTAVDLTIIHKVSGDELNMGTDFDNFTDTAHHSFTRLTEEILQNRLLLKSLMEKHGFIALESEWWHYYWNKAADFELMDIDFRKFRK